MAALKFSWPCWTLALVVVAVTASTFAEQRIFSGHTGMNVTLEFPVPNGTTSLWLKRPGSDKYIFYCRDGHPTLATYQEPSFKGRVEVMDCGRINGTFSATVTNLTLSDSGPYKFHWGDSDGFNETIFLNVSDPGRTGGHREGGGKQADGSVGLIVGHTVSGLVLIVIAGMIYIILSAQRRIHTIFLQFETKM